jgi:hypothetical protein
MKYWRHPGKISVGTNWAIVRKVGGVIGCVIFGLIFVLLPVPFSRFAPSGSRMFWVSIAFWGGLYLLLCIVFLIVKWRTKKAPSAKCLKSPDINRLER